VLVLLLTVLIVDRVIRVRQLKNQSRAVGAPSALIVAQAGRTVDAITRAGRTVAGSRGSSAEGPQQRAARGHQPAADQHGPWTIVTAL
jgi:hypothetical protein